MLYTREGDSLVIWDLAQFNTGHIVDCGQLFRYATKDGQTEIIAQNQKCVLKTECDRVIIKCSDVGFFEDYFDLATDYGEIKAGLKQFDIQNAVNYGSGIRLLRQQPFETLISFIVSANNNIPRIKGILSRLSERLGEKKDGYHAFPTADALASRDEDFYKSLGLGYRAPYIVDTARRIASGFDLHLDGLSTDEARKRLLSLKGVGPKVADCILLFGYQRRDVFPVDTWVKKIYADLMDKKEKNPVKMASKLRLRFGSLSGYAQQYLFYYYRNNFVNENVEE